jgi:hypothetical protein
MLISSAILPLHLDTSPADHLFTKAGLAYIMQGENPNCAVKSSAAGVAQLG